MSKLFTWIWILNWFYFTIRPSRSKNKLSVNPVVRSPPLINEFLSNSSPWNTRVNTRRVIKSNTGSCYDWNCVAFLSDIIETASSKLEKNKEAEWPGWPVCAEQTVGRAGKNLGKMAMQPVWISLSGGGNAPSRFNRFSKSISYLRTN